MRTDDPDVCLEKNPHAHNRAKERGGVCGICGDQAGDA